jgi:SAM-dependent methyltransferase
MSVAEERQERAGGFQPDDAYFDVMAKVARDHWWYRARRDWLAQELGAVIPRGEWCLDIGCGTGEAMDTLGTLLTPEGRGSGDLVGAVAGTDLSSHVLGHVRRRDPATRIMRSLATQLPFADACAGSVVSMCVIEHLDDDLGALREYHRVLRPGGAIFVSVPSYQWLWGLHDDLAAHRRRYSARQLVATVEEAGFVVDRHTYLFSFLVPPAVVMRRTPVRRLLTVTEDEMSMMHPAVDAGFALLARAERAVGRRWRVPFGLSILAVGHKPEPSPVRPPSPDRSA